jgi:hypothetical protein
MTMVFKSDLDIAAIMRDGRAVDRAMIMAGVRAIRAHRAAGVPLVIMRDGKIVDVPADEFDEEELLRAAAAI